MYSEKNFTSFLFRAGKSAGGKVQAAGTKVVFGGVAAARDEGHDRARGSREQGADRGAAQDERGAGASRVGPAHVRLQEAPRGGRQVPGGCQGMPEERSQVAIGSFL